MLLVTKTHHERDETKVPDRLSLQDIGQVETNICFTCLACLVDKWNNS